MKIPLFKVIFTQIGMVQNTYLLACFLTQMVSEQILLEICSTFSQFLNYISIKNDPSFLKVKSFIDVTSTRTLWFGFGKWGPMESWMQSLEEQHKGCRIDTGAEGLIASSIGQTQEKWNRMTDLYREGIKVLSAIDQGYKCLMQSVCYNLKHF